MGNDGNSRRVALATVVVLAVAAAMVMSSLAPAQPAPDQPEAPVGPAAEGEPQAPAAAPAPDPNLKYVGSAVCKPCHTDLHNAWSASKHGQGLAAEGLPESDRGCEACHGPASKHVGSMGKTPIGTTFKGDAGNGEQICGRCHFKDAANTSTLQWQRLDPQQWHRTLHATQEIACLDCHRVHGGQTQVLEGPVGEKCVSCHGALLNSNGYTHAPVAQKQCALCHTVHGEGARHSVARNASNTCRGCHSPDNETFATAHSHYDTSKASCMSCHNPHSFDQVGHLVRKTQHQPFAIRKCEICHVKAAAEGAAVTAPELAKPRAQVCTSCHPDAKVHPKQAPDGRTNVQHPPVEQGLCTLCHNPHASDQPKYIKDRVDYVCFTCHAKIEDAVHEEFPHKPVQSGNCLLCHRPHVSPEKKLINKPSIDLCNSCHASQGQFSHPVGVLKDKTIADPATGEMLTCARCHAVHGGKHDYILANEEDSLCRGCHELH